MKRSNNRKAIEEDPSSKMQQSVVVCSFAGKFYSIHENVIHSAR